MRTESIPTKFPKTLVIGIAGKARSGKDTTCQAIIDNFKDEYDVRRYAFADALKREVNFTEQYEVCLRQGIAYDPNPPMDDPLCNTRHGKQSRLLQYWGEMKRKQDSFYWVKQLADRIYSDGPQIAIISDMRMKNEFYYVKACGGFTVKVNRQGFVDLSRDPKHISETDLDGAKFDVDIDCLDGAVDQLKRDAVTVFQLLVAQMKPVISEIPGLVLAA